MKNLSKETKQEIASMILDAINDGRLNDTYVCEIHNEVFNTDYFIIGYYDAEQWLINNYGVFAAIEKISEYEKDTFGEILTDLGSSEKVCNMLVYILGEEILSKVETISIYWDKKTTKKILNAIKKEIKSLYF